jgi:NitT/TauT family transport system permease protein
MMGIPHVIRQNISPVITIIGFIAVWQLLVVLFNTPQWLLPSPYRVWLSFLQNNHVLGKHVLATGTGAICGLLIGSAVAIALATVMVHSRLLERIIMPLLLIDQSIPKLALAPIFVIWFGTGMTSRIVIAVVISFFPMVVNTARGLTTIDARLKSLMHTLAAGQWLLLTKVRLPNAVPYIFAGLKVSIPLSLIGAVVAEFVQADSGLGFLILIAVSQVDTPLIFVAVVVLATLSLSMFAMVSIGEALLLRRRFGYLIPAQEHA